MKKVLLLLTLVFCLNQKGLAQNATILRDSIELINKPLQDELQKMCDKDQELRVTWSKLDKQFGTNTIQADSIKKLVDKYRHLHTERLKEIYDQHGFPTHKTVGKEGVENILVIAVHSLDVDFQNLTFVYLLLEAKNGSIDWTDLALLMDRMRKNEGKPQYFATQPVKDVRKADEFQLYKIADEKNLDQRRKRLECSLSGII
jgi:hypothetical protein